MTGWWFGTFGLFSIQLGMSSSQLTNSIIFQRGGSTTNQMIIIHYGNANEPTIRLLK